MTWQKQERHSAFFALHDLTHYAVESALGHKFGFFGLIAAGWDIEDTTGKGVRGPLPPDALEIERIVGLFDSECGSGVLYTAEEFNKFSPRQLTDAEIHSVQKLRSELFEQWGAVEPGGRLDLIFQVEVLTELQP